MNIIHNDESPTRSSPRSRPRSRLCCFHRKVLAQVNVSVRKHFSTRIVMILFAGGVVTLLARLVLPSLSPSTLPQQHPDSSTRTKTTTTTTKASKPKKHLTVVVPGFGDMSRLKVLKESLQIIQKTTTTASSQSYYGFDCYVYVWNDNILQDATTNLSSSSSSSSSSPLGCHVVPNKGLWTHHMKRVPPMITESSKGEEEEGLNLGSSTSTSYYVAVLMDDIDLTTHRVDTGKMIETMESQDYKVVSASFPPGTVHRPSMQHRKQCVSHETSYVDILYTIFDVDTWNCWQSNIDLDINPYGWGYDLTLADVCNVKVGVIDDHALAVHATYPCETKPNGGCRKSSYDTKAARAQMWAWIDHVAAVRSEQGYNNSLTSRGYVERANHTAADNYKTTVTNRWRNFPTCDKNETKTIH